MDVFIMRIKHVIVNYIIPGVDQKMFLHYCINVMKI